jgi:type II secretory pathway pseudopilin PulG
LIEVLVTLSVMVVAASIFCQMLLSGSRLRAMNHESALAADGARVVLERMRNEPFLEVYRDYNEDPKDDPAGNGTGPGYLFDVPGLDPLPGAPQGKVGRVFFPTKVVLSGGGGKLGALGGAGQATTTWILREDVEDASLGMPRDLNGDNVVDVKDHSADYLLLPVRVEVEWKSPSGARRFEITTQLGDFPTETP